MLVTASIALLGVSLGGVSATFEPLPVESVSTPFEVVPIAFRSETESPWRCLHDVNPLDVRTGAILERTYGSHSVELLPTECRFPIGTSEPGDSVSELRRIEHAARSAGVSRVPASGITDASNRSFPCPNGPHDLMRTVLLPCGPFRGSEPFPGGHDGLEAMLTQLESEDPTGCAGEVEAVGGSVVSVAGVHPGSHDDHASWGMGPTMLAIRLLEASSSERPICIDGPLSCQHLARRSFLARAGAASTGWCDVTSENQSRPVCNSGDHSALHVGDFALPGMSRRTTMLEEDCIMAPTGVTSAFREEFSEPKERAVRVTCPSGFGIVVKQLFLAECSSLGAACHDDLDDSDQRGFDSFPSVEFPICPVAMPIRASGELDGCDSVDGAGLFCSLGWWC